MLSSVPVAESSFVVLSIPRGWTILDSCPPRMGGQEASDLGNFWPFPFSGDFLLFSVSMTVFVDDSELSLS